MQEETLDGINDLSGTNGLSGTNDLKERPQLRLKEERGLKNEQIGSFESLMLHESNLSVPSNDVPVSIKPAKEKQPAG
mgnify:CR=1 FL=1